MKKSTPTKFLCMFLSLLMAFSAFGVLTPVAFAEGSGSVTDAMWTTLADALRGLSTSQGKSGSSRPDLQTDSEKGQAAGGGAADAAGPPG